MEMLAPLGRTIGFSFAAGVNLYATIAILGLAARYHWVPLPSEYQVFNNPWVIGIALGLYVIEFFADKIPWLDSVWDVAHTIVRPLGGAFIAVSSLGSHPSAITEVAAAFMGGGIAASSHLTKASTRVVANSSPEPFSNWALSLGEDAFVIGLGFLALRHPVAALIVCTILLVVIVACAALILRAVRRRFARARAAVA